MFRSLFGRQRGDGIPAAIYGAIVAQARSVSFYTDFRVPNSIEGRFELLVLHCAILLRRCRDGDAALQAAGQGVFDLFCQDMDRSLRTLGVGDLGVPKRMKQVGQAFYGRSAAYDAALGDGDGKALAGAIGRNFFAGDEPALAGALAAYTQAAVGALARALPEVLLSGHLPFPDPASYMPLAHAHEH